MYLQWSEDRYGTGFAKIDAQHQELFRQINALLEASVSGKTVEVLGEMLELLETYIVEHFSHEEWEMERRKCSACKENEAAHRAFLGRFEVMSARFQETGATNDLVKDLQAVVCDWLSSHIRDVDTQLRNSATLELESG